MASHRTFGVTIENFAGDVTCDAGGFAYTSFGSWDGNGFHAAGMVDDDSDDFEGLKGRITHIDGAGSDAGDGASDIAYEMVVDKVENWSSPSRHRAFSDRPYSSRATMAFPGQPVS